MEPRLHFYDEPRGAEDFRHEFPKAAFISRPRCRLWLEIEGLSDRTRELIDALLRVDLGARVKVEGNTGEVDVDGWFHKEEVVAAVLDLGCRLIRVEDRPPSTAVMTSLR